MCDFEKFDEYQWQYPGKVWWNKLRIKTMKDNHDLYLKYVLFLVDVFENFRNRCLENYCLCPSHHLSAPPLKLDA